MIRPRLATAAALLVAVGVVAIPEDAKAAGYLTARYGTDEGTPAMPNAFAIYYNPAALTGTTGTTITGDLSLLARFIRYTRPESALSPSDPSFKSDPTYVRSNSGTANLSNFLALPFFGVNTDFGTKNLRAGYAVYIPYGGLDSWTHRTGQPNDPGSVDGVQRWQNISGVLMAVYNTFAVAYRLPAHISLGASISPVAHILSTTAARNADGSDDTVQNNQLTEGRVKVDGTGFNLAATGGVYFDPTNKVHIGASYISQPGFGDTKIHGTLRTQLGSGQESQSRVDFIQTYPDVVRLGATVMATPKLMIRGDVDFERWSVFNRQCIVAEGTTCAVSSSGQRLSAAAGGNNVQLNLPRNWKDAVSIRLGPAYRVVEDIDVFGSLAFGTSAVPKEWVDVTTIDSDALFFTLGAHWHASEHWNLAASYNHVYYFTVNTEGKSETSLPQNPDPSYNVSRSPSANGRYREQVGFLNLNVAYTF